MIDEGFTENGYQIIPSVFNEPELSALRNEADKVT